VEDYLPSAFNLSISIASIRRYVLGRIYRDAKGDRTSTMTAWVCYSYKYYKMEAELLRDFLSLTEGMWEQTLSTRLSTVTRKSIPSRSCASSLACPEAVTTAMWSGWDLYDNSIVAYKTAAQQTVNLVLDTIRLAMKKEKRKVAAELQLHSDQGFQYTSREYFNLTQSYGITPSMSRRGNCYDNAMAENFFSILKTECIYRRKPKMIHEAQTMIDDYIHFYNYERIQTKTGVAPLMLRHSA